MKHIDGRVWLGHISQKWHGIIEYQTMKFEFTYSVDYRTTKSGAKRALERVAAKLGYKVRWGG